MRQIRHSSILAACVICMLLADCSSPTAPNWPEVSGTARRSADSVFMGPNMLERSSNVKGEIERTQTVATPYIHY